MNKCGKHTTLSERLRASDHSVRCHQQYLIRGSLGRDGAVVLFPQQQMKQCSVFRLSDTGFDVLPLSTPTAVTGNRQRCHTDTASLWSRWRVDAAKISNCMACDLSSLCVSLSHISCALLSVSVSASQAPVMALYWSITWPVVFSTKNSVSTLAKSGKISTSVYLHLCNKAFPPSAVHFPLLSKSIHSWYPLDEVSVKWLVRWTPVAGSQLEGDWFSVDCFQAH